MRTLTSIAVILAALAGILGLSIWSALGEHERLMDAFATTTRQQVHASVEALSARLDALDQDTRMLTDLLERSRDKRDADPATERRVWDSAFTALTVVVAQYRAIAFVDASGVIQVLAADPTEQKEIIDSLLPPARELAADVSKMHAKALGAPARHGDRSFLLYGSPVRGGGAIVVASDAAIFLGAVAWTPLPVARLFVTDPAGVVWAGCETPRGCGIMSSEAVPSSLPPTTASYRYVGARGSRAVTLGPVPAVQVSERLARPTGDWTVTWLASTEALVARERSLLARIILTALAAALAVAGVGAAILRQQRRAVTLESRLQVAQALVRAEKLITVGVLSAGIAHEIGSPLAVIRGRAEQVLNHLGATGARADDVRVIIKHIDNISSTIRQLLDFSRRQPVAPSAVPFDVAIERARGLLQWKLEANGLTLEVALDDDLPMLAADPDQLQQVLVNLLLNACDASETGRSVLIEASATGKKEVAFSVVDHGCGIAPSDMNAVFDPFFTTKKRGEGTGLGLTIAAGIVRNHAGQINLSSAPGAGTTVTVLWPTIANRRAVTHA
ncbi:MAG TPA: ATP-binding protein [Polyangia bacterium]